MLYFKDTMFYYILLIIYKSNQQICKYLICILINNCYKFIIQLDYKQFLFKNDVKTSNL